MAASQTKWQAFVGGFRILTTRVAVVPLLALVLFTKPVWPEGGRVDSTLHFASMLLLATGVMGRLWCTLFISGFKTKHLITSGPYSVVRNPLYVFSLLGGLGLALGTGMFSMALLVAVLFALYYPTVIVLEEQKLRAIHGAAFDDYCQRVPSLVPRLSLYQEPENYEMRPRFFRKAMLDGLGFFMIYPLLEVIKHLHYVEKLPFWRTLF
jgi:protein-S-isoprenylcysteine O-methyltransferase Ste14